MSNNLHASALVKFLIMLVFSIALNILCENGFAVVSWLIVFVPFVTLTILTTLILYIFSISKTAGDHNSVVPKPNREEITKKANTLNTEKHLTNKV